MPSLLFNSDASAPRSDLAAQATAQHQVLKLKRIQQVFAQTRKKETKGTAELN